jgi:hypothetical protein
MGDGEERAAVGREEANRSIVEAPRNDTKVKGKGGEQIQSPVSRRKSRKHRVLSE